MSLRYHTFIFFILIIPVIIIGTMPDSKAAVQDVRLRDITPRALLSHSAVDIAVTDSELITLGAGNLLLNVYDVRDVINPRRRSYYDLPSQGSSISAEGKIAFVTCPGRGLVIIDVTKLQRPGIVRIHECNLGANPGVLVTGDYVYLHDGWNTFTVYHRNRPWELEEVARVNVRGYGNLVYMNGYVYFASDGVAAVDVSNPAALRLTVNPMQGSAVSGIAAAGGMVCTVDGEMKLTVFRAIDRGGLEEISSYDVGQTMRDVAMHGNIVAVVTADDLITFDISKPGKIRFHGDLPLICELRKVVSRDGLFFIASELDGPLVADVSDPLRQKVIAYQAGLGLVSTIASRGSLMLAGSWDSIRALERREEGEEEIIGIQHSELFTREIQITGDFAYLADPTRGLRVFNISRPIFMRPVALLELPGTPSDVELVGELAFIPLGDEGVAQVNIHFPFNPVLRMTIETEHPCTNVTKAGDYLYFISPEGYVGIYDISVPTQPRQAAWLELTGVHPIDAQVYGDMMAISGGTDGLWLFNVADPIHPVLRSKYIPGGSVETAALFDDGVVLEVKGPGYCKIEVVDLRYVFAPYKRAELELKERSDYNDKLHVVGDRAYLAAYNYGLKVFEMTGLFE